MGITNIEIQNNPALDSCGLPPFCTYLNEGGEFTISNNGINCDSGVDIAVSCGLELNQISGTILFDFDSNGCNTGDYSGSNLQVVATSNTNTYTTYTDEQGNYSLLVGAEEYTIVIDQTLLLGVFQSNPSSVVQNFEDGGNEAELNFCLEAITMLNDVTVTLLPLQEPRPGFEAKYIISYSNQGTFIESGEITFNFDNESVFYVDAEITPNTITASSLIWQYDNLQPFETRFFEVIFEVFTPPTVEGGEILSSNLSITTLIEDDVSENNISTLREIVVNSFDPNDKQVLQGERILEEEVGDYLDYIVRFQNTGTADAINVIVTDKLSNNLNWGSLSILGASHNYRVEITNGNNVAFIFENINLPSEEQDAEGSNGYIAFQIQSNDDLILEDVIENTANIFFDFNAPIITNTVITTVSELCPDGDLVFTSQADIDDFAVNFPDCTSIIFPYNLTISGDDIVDLSPLSQITSVNNLIIDGNPQLTSLTGLDNLVDIASNLVVSNNPILISLNGLGAFGFTGVEIVNNDTLVNLDGLNDLQDVFGMLIIEGNDALQNLVGLESYFGSLYFIVRNNQNLTSLEGINSDLNFVETVSIQDNPLLTDISTLQNLNQILISFEIRNNDSLTNLDGLQFDDVISDFTIIDNDALVDISALSEIPLPSETLEISGNSSLSDCVISLLCDNITNTEIVFVNNNGSNCSSNQEVEEACILDVNEELLESSITIYPNPTVNTLNVVFPPEIQLQRIDLFSITGKKIINAQTTSIDVSELSKGIYFARIQTNQGTIVKKIVKK